MKSIWTNFGDQWDLLKYHNRTIFLKLGLIIQAASYISIFFGAQAVVWGLVFRLWSF